MKRVETSTTWMDKQPDENLKQITTELNEAKFKLLEGKKNLSVVKKTWQRTD